MVDGWFSDSLGLMLELVLGDHRAAEPTLPGGLFILFEDGFFG
jgi:hypothetical protein